MKIRPRPVSLAKLLTQGELASRIGLTQTTISRLEPGIIPPSLLLLGMRQSASLVGTPSAQERRRGEQAGSWDEQGDQEV